MATTIVTKNSTTAASVPSAGSLTQGELAVNVTDKRLFTKDSGGTVVEVGTNPSVLTVGGAFAANGGVTLGDASGDALTINSSAVSIPNGLNFDSNTLVIDATNNAVGIGTSSPLLPLHVVTTGTSTSAFGNAISTFRSGAAGRDASIQFSDGTNTGNIGQLSGNLLLGAGGNERMRIDSSGKVGVGTSSPSSYDSSSLMAVVSASNTSITVGSGSTGLGQILFANGTSGASVYNGLIRYDHNGNAMSFFTNGGNQRMIIDSSGNLLVGQTSRALSEKLGVTNSGGIAAYFNGSTGSGAFTGDDLNHYMITCQSKAGTSATHYQIGFINSVGSTVGGITHNNSNTTYATSSDYRLKENIALMTGALNKVGLLKPCTYVWKETGEASQGFIAHELAEVIPDAVVGEKDAVNEDGSIRPQGIDTSYLVATLTAAIQEQQAIITDLKSRITALENK